MSVSLYRTPLLCATCIFALSVAGPAPLLAQSADGVAVADLDIVVTARKRNETSIAAPVALTAIGGRELETRAINTVDALARAVPQLMVGESGGSIQGGIIAIRGISGADANPFGDQAVSFNIDGVQIARASVRRMAEMDMEQVEVLKGPQALFFGKNSPGGIISIRTADPSSTFSAKMSAGYELNAREFRAEGHISGPLTDTLGARVAFYGSTMRGWVKSIVPESSPFSPKRRHGPFNDEGAIRATLKFAPSDRFDARLKLTYARNKGAATTGNMQILSCPTGTPQTGAPLDDCRADDRIATGDLGPNFARVDPRFGNGVPVLRQYQVLGGLEMNYHLTDDLTLTSVTGYYRYHLRTRGNFTANYVNTPSLPQQILANYTFLDIRETAEELRLTSSFDGPLNFMIGGHYQDSHATTGLVTLRNADNPTYVSQFRLIQDGKAYSAFGQLLWKIVPTLELSAGGRYSHEAKRLPTVQAGAVLVDVVPNPGTTRSGTWNNFSPEATLSYRPSGRMTVYGSYKRGFLSGGFNSGNTNFAANLKYDQQTVEGFEGGLKASLLDGALRTNFSLYDYKTKGLQVVVTVTGVTQELRNAGSVRTKGAEFDFKYRTPIDGLSLHGALSYNRGRYLDYQATCYVGQPQPLCTQQLNRQTGQTALLQDLSGQQLSRAPEWTGGLGFSYETPITGTLKIGFSGDTNFSDSYFTDGSNAPNGTQKSYQLFDAGIRVGALDDAWELALIGRNLSDEYYVVRGSSIPFSGTAAGAAIGTPSRLADLFGSVSRGREVMMRLSVKFGG